MYTLIRELNQIVMPGVLFNVKDINFKNWVNTKFKVRLIEFSGSKTSWTLKSFYLNYIEKYGIHTD